MKGVKAGYYIDRVFVSLIELRVRVEKIKKETLPF